MTTFLLIRHATNDLVGKVIAGWTPGVHLNDEGRRQAEHLGRWLGSAPIAAIYSSPLERTRETAAPLAERLGLEVHLNEALGEVRFGEWTGRTMEELAREPRWQRWNSFRTGARAPGGELMIEVQTRIVAALEEIRARHPDEVVAVFSHGDPIRSTIAYYASIPLDQFLRIEVSPASVSVITVHDWGPKILRLNDTGEMPPFF